MGHKPVIIVSCSCPKNYRLIIYAIKLSSKTEPIKYNQCDYLMVIVLLQQLSRFYSYDYFYDSLKWVFELLWPEINRCIIESQWRHTGSNWLWAETSGCSHRVELMCLTVPLVITRPMGIIWMFCLALIYINTGKGISRCPGLFIPTVYAKWVLKKPVSLTALRTVDVILCLVVQSLQLTVRTVYSLSPWRETLKWGADFPVCHW